MWAHTWRPCGNMKFGPSCVLSTAYVFELSIMHLQRVTTTLFPTCKRSENPQLNGHLVAVIRVTSFNEPIDDAIQSVIDGKRYFSRVVIVSKGGLARLRKCHVDALQEAQIPFTLTSSFPDRFDAVHTGVVENYLSM